MARISLAASVVLIVFVQSLSAAPKEALTYELSLVFIFENARTEYIFVIGNSGFKTVASLEKFIATLPPGTTLRWSPGCERFGDEPLLSSERDMAGFISFCRLHEIHLVLVPSG